MATTSATGSMPSGNCLAFEERKLAARTSAWEACPSAAASSCGRTELTRELIRPRPLG